ncbi:MAG: hypothetical protein JXB33_08935 [Clostridia bacterium]|nr:hypothetical protein [Clostridia bacterium]
MKNKLLLFIIIAVLLTAGCSAGTETAWSEVERLEAEVAALNNEKDAAAEREENLRGQMAILQEELDECMEKIAGEIEPRFGGPSKTSPLEGNEWTLIDYYGHDLDGDGTDEITALYTSAERDASGEMMWDDGQDFILMITDGSDYYTLFKEFVQIGMVYFSIHGATDEAPAGVLTFVSTGAGLRLEKSTYNVEDGGYVIESVYDAGSLNVMYNSFPCG